MANQLDTILEMVKDAEEYRPAVQEVVKIIKSYGPELSELMYALYTYAVDKKAEGFKRLVQKHGFSREEALTLIIDVHSDIARAARQSNANVKRTTD